MSLPGIGISVAMEGGRVLTLISGLRSRFADPKPVGYAIAKILRRSFAKNIDAGGRPAFAPLRRNTLASKAFRGLSPRALVGTGDLRRSVAQRNAKGNVTYVAADGSVKVGSNLPQAAFAQAGTKPHLIAPRRSRALAFVTASKGYTYAKKVHHPGTPPRKWMVIQDEDRRKIADLMMRYAEEGLRPEDTEGD